MLVRLWRKENPRKECTVGGDADWCNHYRKQYGISSENYKCAFWPGNSTAGIIPWEYWNTNSKEPMHSSVHSSTIYNSECWKQPKCASVNDWIKKLWYTMEYYAAERKKELLPSMTAWMELERIVLSEISQVVKDKYHMISPISKKQTSKQNITRDIEIKNNRTVTWGEVGGNGGGKWRQLYLNDNKKRNTKNKKQ